MSNYS